MEISKLLQEGKTIPYKVLEKRHSRESKKEEEILSMREALAGGAPKRKYSSPPDHPWRKWWRSSNVTFQIGNKV